MERSARTALGGTRGGSAGGGREAPQPGLDVDARAARDGKCLIKPRLARQGRTDSWRRRPECGRTQPPQRVHGAGVYLRGTNLAPQGLLTAVWGSTAS